MHPALPVDWHDAEEPLLPAALRELRRLLRRARAHAVLVLALASALTALAVARGRPSPPREAVVVLAVEEGALADGRRPLLPHELRQYVEAVLLSADALLALARAEGVVAPDTVAGDAGELEGLREMLEVEVHRNYFLYGHDADAPRTARIVVRFAHPDVDRARRMAHGLARTIGRRDEERRRVDAAALAAGAARTLEAVAEHAAGLAAEVIERDVALARSEHAGERGQAAALRAAARTHEAALGRHEAALGALAQDARADQQAAAAELAGLGLRVTVAEERPPPHAAPTTTRRRLAGLVAGWLALVVVVGLAAGALGRAVLDAEDVRGLGLPVLGVVAALPGDAPGRSRRTGGRR